MKDARTMLHQVFVDERSGPLTGLLGSLLLCYQDIIVVPLLVVWFMA